MGSAMKVTSRERVVLREVAKTLKREFAAREVIMFGSAARGEMDAFSDVDLFVVLPAVDWEREKKICDLCFEAGLKIGRVISTLCVSLHDLAKTPLRADPLVSNVKAEGVRL